MTTLLGETAEDNSSPLGLKACRNSLINVEKAALSESGPFLQST
jgi:hypothetical protein